MPPDLDDRSAERAVAVGVMIVAAAVGLALVNLAPDRSHPAAVAAPATTAAPAVTSGPTTTSSLALGPTTTAPPTTAVDAGALPQTETRPEANGGAFDTRVQGLWNAIVRDDPTLAMPFFFPKSAYLQVKAVANPALDYASRLIAHYEEDVHTLHQQLGNDAASAQFTGIDVPGANAVWVQPGEETNKLSYWRVYGSTLRYTVNGATLSFPVTSLISWRGEWYVVHLGEIR